MVKPVPREQKRRIGDEFRRIVHAYPKRPRGLTVGLLGGSFNPAHDGHRHVSLMALRILNLDRVWWIVSPQNPLKPTKGMAPFEDRLAAAGKLVASEPRILVADIENRLGTRHTAATLRRLKRQFPKVRFVWLMGADNLIQISKWKDWTTIFGSVPIAVFARPSYCMRAMSSPAARRFAEFRVSSRKIRGLATREPPAWAFLWIKPHVASSTEIRRRRT